MYSEWANTLNAQLYEQYAQTYSIYHETARRLVALADIRPGMTAVDLACGTGIVTQQLHSLLTDTGTIIAVDQSAAMLAVAQQKFSTRTVRLIRSSAETIDEHLPEGSVDVVVCNSAFWQTNMHDTVKALQRILKGGARFLFNLSLAQFPTHAKPPLQRPPSSLLPSLMLQIARDEYGYALPQRSKLRHLTAEEVGHLLVDTLFTLVSWEDAIFEETAEDAYAFLHIPVMSEACLPGLDYTTRLAVLDKAYQQFAAVHSDAPAWRYAWRYYILEKGKG